MSGLNLGDIVFDPQRFLYIKSLKAIVCCHIEGDKILPKLWEQIALALVRYKACSLIILGNFQCHKLSLNPATKQWDSIRIQWITTNPSKADLAAAEAWGAEIHHELLWGIYRFVEAAPEAPQKSYFFTIGGVAPTPASYVVKVGRTGWGLGGLGLPLFLRGWGQIILPALNPRTKKISVFRNSLLRYDIFAVGYSRVLPLGKVSDLKKVRTRGHIPVAFSALVSKRRKFRQISDETSEGVKDGEHLA